MGASRTASAPDEPWDRYARAVVEIRLPEELLILTPRPHSAVAGPTEVAVADAASHRPTGAPALVAGRLDAPVTILTAGDPYPVQLEAEENRARMDALIAALDRAGLAHLPALGRSPDHRESEPSRALLGVDRATGLRIAATYGQLAVFEIDADSIACVAVADGTVRTRRAYDVRTSP